MKKVYIGSILIQYLKQKRRDTLLFCIFSIIFTMVFYLYKLAVEAVLYAALISSVVGLIFITIDFISFYRQHKILSELRHKITIGIDDLPKANNLLEQDYNTLIGIIHHDKIRMINRYESTNSDMVDYYTLWVHQIKTPISAMRLLLMSQNDSDNKELLSELFKIEQYVEMVLCYLRLDSSFTDYVIKEYPLDSIVKQAVHKYAPLFIRKKIKLELSPLDCMVLTDEKWLLFVIEQILSNAIKYTSKGKVSIHLCDNKTLVIKDTGMGIAKEDLPRLGEKGFTGYNGRADKKATGIGLYLSKRILKKLSHSITIDSIVGSYTKVSIRLDSADGINE